MDWISYIFDKRQGGVEVQVVREVAAPGCLKRRIARQLDLAIRYVGVLEDASLGN